MPVALLVTVFVDALMAAALLFLTRECQTKTILRFICTVIVVCVGIMLLINIIKVPWGRARMRLIYSTGNDTYFSNWWQAGTALKTAFRRMTSVRSRLAIRPALPAPCS